MPEGRHRLVCPSDGGPFPALLRYRALKTAPKPSLVRTWRGPAHNKLIVVDLGFFQHADFARRASSADI